MNNLLSKAYEGAPFGCRQGQAFRPYNCRGYTSLKVLPELSGKEWNDYALGLIHALRPSHVRVITGMEQLDAQTWRVTVFIDEKNIIKAIKQEVEVGLPEDCFDGASAALMRKLKL